jgi:hypothetical protein
MFRFVDALFGCAHRQRTFPRTAKNPGAESTTYVVCLECGKEFPYDWQAMKVVERTKRKQPTAA